MTPAATPEALEQARALVRHSLKVGAPGLSETAREAVLRSIMLKLEGKVLAPVLADLQRVTAERDEARAMRRWNIDRTGDGEVLVCRGYHDKGEDCDHERFVPEERLATATAEAASLRAEVEAKVRRIATLTKALKPFAEYARLSDEAGLNIGHGEIGEFIHGGLRHSIHTRDLEAARTALARAATAGEGRSDG